MPTCSGGTIGPSTKVCGWAACMTGVSFTLMSATAHPHEGATLTPEIAAALARPEQRVEGPLKVTGRARYSGDATMPDMLWAGFLMSPLPHARILSIDTS